MLHHSPRERAFALGLAALAGFVDAIGFLALGGFFVSFMSGNTTRAAVGIADGTSAAVTALLLILGFLIGVIAASLIGHATRRRVPTILATVATLLSAAALADWLGAPQAIVFGFVVMGMGAVNTVFERGGEVSIGLTYMTGNLVKLGQHIATALRGVDRLGWWPFLLLWLSLSTGAILGALAFRQFGLGALWIAAAWAVAAAVAAIASQVNQPPR